MPLREVEGRQGVQPPIQRPPASSDPLIERAQTISASHSSPVAQHDSAAETVGVLSGLKEELEDIRAALQTLARSQALGVLTSAPSLEERPSSAVSAGSPHAAAADDLKLLPGVGAALERTLRELGVETFRQIATWSPVEMESISARLGSSGSRVARDQWIESAKQQHFLKYGERL